MKKHLVFLSLAALVFMSASLFFSVNDARAAITVSGSIANMAPEQSSFSLRTSTVSYQVIISSIIKLTDSNGAIAIADLNDGMGVSVTGVKNTDGAIQAETIATVVKTFAGTISEFNPTYPEDTINAASFILRNGSYATWVVIPRGAKLLDSNGPIKLEDLNDGMSISVKGAGTLNSFIRAETIAV